MKRIIKKRNNKKYLIKNTLITLFILFHHIKNSQTLTKNYNNYKPIQIYSNYQNINIANNTLTITGNVFIQDNYSNLYADKVIIIYPHKQNKEKIIKAYGNPVIFYQSKNNNKQMLATSLYMTYKTIDNTIILEGRAFFKKKIIH